MIHRKNGPTGCVFPMVVTKLIGVIPTRERAARRRLFDALELAFPVRFEGREPGRHDGLDAALLLPGSGPPEEAVGDRLPVLVAVGEEAPAPPPAPLGERPRARGPALRLGTIAPLDRRLRGTRLRDAAVKRAPAIEASAADAVLATRGGDPMWVSRPARGAPVELVAVAPAELGEEECLRDRLRDGRFLALAALVHFLRSACGDAGWRPPGLRASFMFDDPNLHWTSYGHLPYRELVRHADAHGYHVAFAMVPLDGWFAHPAAVRLFRERPDRLSLIVHGNNHTRLELAHPDSRDRSRALLAQALRRTRAFERRSGLRVGRVMAAPHGVCSEPMARSLVPMGFEALCISRPYPWLARPPAQWLARPPGASPLAGWEPASLVADGVPVLLRRGFDDPEEDLALRAFLDQPLIVYGHHGDMKSGLDRLAHLAGVIQGLGDVEWMSPGEIAATGFATLHEGDTMRVRMFSRRALVPVPDGVRRLEVEVQPLESTAARDQLAWACNGCGAGQSPALEPIALPEGAAGVEVRLVRSGAPDPPHIETAQLPLRAVARRAVGEGRDRLAPLYRSATRTIDRRRGRVARDAPPDAAVR
jgi:hypothetical protein